MSLQKEATGALHVRVSLSEEEPDLFAVRTVIEAPSGYRFESFHKTFPTREWAEQAFAIQMQAWIDE